MKIIRIPLLRSLFPVGLFIALIVSASADPPKKPSVAQFTSLISGSPFTIKPPPPERTVAGTPLERDWMLGSIRPIKGGYSVTLINKKDRKDRIRFIPGFSAGEFQLLEVKQDISDSANSRVRVRKGSVEGWLTYDEKLIKVRPAVAANRSTGKSTGSNSKRTSSSSGPPVPGQSTSRSSRQRTVPKRTK